jgi:NADPH-dependent 2,4-dienoyl-CoA reductase/sulfur reductase-like enzyme
MPSFPVPRQVVVAGGGLAGLRTIETLRRAGFEGRVTLVGEEASLPYDRPSLSKEALTASAPPADTILSAARRLADLEVELLLGEGGAVGLDLDARRLKLVGGELDYDALVLATGAAPRVLPGLDGLERVHTLRSFDDAMAIRADLDRIERLLVVGAGFIGGEVAASARRRGIEVEIVEAAREPLRGAVGAEVGETVCELHRRHGTELTVGVGVLRGEETSAGVALHLDDGRRVEADAVVLGIGVLPALDWLEGSGLELGDGVICEADLTAGRPDVFAVGDVCSWPNRLFGRRMRVEHWTNASEQARHVARDLAAGARRPFAGTNYVWSDQYEERLQMVGIATPDVRVVEGSLDSGRYLAWYVEDEVLVGAFAIGIPELLGRTRMMIGRRLPVADALRELAADPAEIGGRG